MKVMLKNYLIDCNNFLSHNNFLHIIVFTYYKKGDGFGVAKKPQPSGILKWKIVWKKKDGFSNFNKKSCSLQNIITKISVFLIIKINIFLNFVFEELNIKALVAITFCAYETYKKNWEY